MNENEQEAFEAIVSAETNSLQRNYLEGLMRVNTRHMASVCERQAEPALFRLWSTPR